MVSSLDNWDGSLSSAAGQNASRIADFVESAGASTLNKTSSVQDERMNTLGWHDMVTGSDVDHAYDASNMSQPLSRDVPIVVSLPTHTTLSFTPISSSSLHNAINKLPVQTPILLNLVSSTPPPMDALETISTYTADGDGDIVEIEDANGMLTPYSSPKSQPHHEQNASAPSYDGLFTPPPEQDTRSILHFTSYPSPKQTQAKPASVYRKPRLRRLIMSHIEVPPLKRPRSDYRPDYRPSSTTLPSIVSIRRVAPNPLQEALQASIQHNANLGALDSLHKQKRKLMKQRRDGEADIVVGHPNGTKTTLKRSFMDDDGDWGPASRDKKRPRPISDSMILDLTITDDDDHAPLAVSSSTKASQNPRPKVKPIPKLPIFKPMPPRPLIKPRFMHAKYNSETDVVTLCLEDIRPLPLEILTVNTRFLRQSLESDINAIEDSPCTRQNGSRPCLSSPSSTKDSQEEVSVGGIIRVLAEEWEQNEVIEILSESDALKENAQKDVPSTSLVPTLKNQNQKKPREPHIHVKKAKHRQHPTGDDVNGSSSTFKVPFEVGVSSLPAPRATPDTTQYPKTQYPKKKHREPQHGPLPAPRAIPDRTQYPKTQYPKKKHREPQHSPLPAPRAIPDTTQYPKTQYPKKKHREPQHGQQQKQTSGEDIHGSSTIPVELFPPKDKLAPQHPKKPLDSQLLQLPQNDSPVRPPHSSRSSLNGQTLGSESDYFNGAMPSAKALGKRRAISPMSISGTTSPHRHPHSPVPPYSPASIRDIQLTSHLSSPTPTHNLNSDFNPFINYPTAISPAVQSSYVQANGVNTFSLSNSYNPLDTLSSLYDQAASASRNQSEIHIGSDMDSSRHTSTHSHILPFDSQPQSGSGSRGESFLSSADFLYDDVGVSGDQHDDQYIQEPQQQQYDTTVSSLVENQPEDQYTCLTIDPTLLGGGAHLEEAESVEMDMMDEELDAVEMEADDQGPKADVRRSSSADPSYSPASIRAKKTSPTEDKEEGTYARKLLPPRIRKKRVMPDMISHDDMALMSKRSKAAKTNIRLSISSTSPAPDSDESSSDSEPDESDHEKKSIPVRKAPRVDRRKQDWQMEDVNTYCHQCRNRTFLAKMTCSDCQKKYCVRCYAFRYPECEFDADDDEFSCPACEGFCNCTVCCRKRGEAYVGLRTCDASPPPRPYRPRNTNVERVKLGAKTNLPPLTTAIQTTAIPEGVTNAWGSLYSVTGEKIGSCFFDPSAEKDSLVFAPATTPIMTTMTEVAQQQVATAAAAPTIEPKIKVKRKRKHKRRIFIGIVQDCWGYTKPKIKQLEAEPYSKRSYNSMPRYYIGKKKYLFYPVEEDESSLTAMDESDEAPGLDTGTDAEGISFLPDSLGDGDVTRAIFLGLTACGLSAVPAIDTK